MDGTVEGYKFTTDPPLPPPHTSSLSRVSLFLGFVFWVMGYHRRTLSRCSIS
jgi:hypothetical protein